MNLLQFVCAFCVLGLVVAATIPTDGVIFPNRKTSKGCGSNCPQQNAIPISMAKELSNIQSSDQFLRMFVENGDFAKSDFNAFHPIGFRSSFPQPSEPKQRVPPANCKPELRTISLRDTNDPTLIYYPMCVRLEQCGGCCNHELLSCEHNKSSPVNVTIMMTKYMGNKTLKYIGKKTVTLLKHEQCSCDCKTKPKDCTGRQVYRKDECRCVCENETEEKECQDDRQKLWNPSTCQCTCREEQECSTGYVFDASTCSCKKTPEWQSYDSVYFRERI